LPDQQQIESSYPFGAWISQGDRCQPRYDGCSHVGQEFVPQATPLVRLDLRLDNRRDPRPGRIRIWRWRNTYEETITQSPAYDDVIDFMGRSGTRLHSFYPRIAVDPGQRYYLELSRSDSGTSPAAGAPETSPWSPGPAPFSARGVLRDAYPAGRVRWQCAWRSEYDLWFRTFTAGDKAAALAGETRVLKPSPAGALWTPPQGAVSLDHKAEYLRIVDERSRRNRCDDGTRLTGCADGAQRQALVSALRYHLSCAQGACDAALAEQVAMLLNRYLYYVTCDQGLSIEPTCSTCGRTADGARQLCLSDKPAPKNRIDFDQHPFFPVLAYYFIREAKLADDVRQNNLRLMREIAAGMWPQRELGAHNRALAGGLTYLILTRLLPDAPERASWLEYAEARWNDFWQYREIEDDSASYVSGVATPILLWYARIADTAATRAIWQDQRFQRWIERQAQTMTPFGALAAYGDGSGWSPGSGAGYVWLFEKAAASQQSPHYKWLAAQLFSHHLRRACSDDMLNWFHLMSLTGAYLDADPTVGPVAPSSQVSEELILGQNDGAASWAGGRVGQIVQLDKSPLVRVDVRLRTKAVAQAANFRIWRWQGNFSATRGNAANLVYDEVFGLPVPSKSFSEKSFFPYVPVVGGAKYYLEIEAAQGAFELAGSSVGSDRYRGGELLVAGFAKSSDLWFRLYTLTQNGSRVTWRNRVTSRRAEQWGCPQKTSDVHDTLIPDKLILRSGYGDDSLFGLFNLVPVPAAHSGFGAGALLALTKAGSVLLTDTPTTSTGYFSVVDDHDASTPVVRRHAGGVLGAPPQATQIRRLWDARRTAVAVVSWNDVHGWNAEQERQFYFVKDRFLLVRDVFRLPAGMRASVGPIWHASDVRSERGDNWVAVYTREPISNVYKIRNPEHYSLMYFVSRPGAEVGAYTDADLLATPEGCPVDTGSCGVQSVWDPVQRKLLNCLTSAPHVFYQRREHDGSRQETYTFDTLFLPFGPAAAGTATPAAVAQNVSVLQRQGSAVVLGVKIGSEAWTVVLNPDEAPITAGELTTDASVMIAESGLAGSAYVLVDRATNVRLGKRIDRRWGSRSSSELVGAGAP
jgi:hypothetical protein